MDKLSSFQITNRWQLYNSQQRGAALMFILSSDTMALNSFISKKLLFSNWLDLVDKLQFI